MWLTEGSHGVPTGFPRGSLGVPTGFPRGSLGVPSGFPRGSHGVPAVRSEGLHSVRCGLPLVPSALQRSSPTPHTRIAYDAPNLHAGLQFCSSGFLRPFNWESCGIYGGSAQSARTVRKRWTVRSLPVPLGSHGVIPGLSLHLPKAIYASPQIPLRSPSVPSCFLPESR